MFQAPRGTFDVLPADAARRAVLQAHAERILGAAGFGRIKPPTFEATELFQRGVGEATDIVQKEMYSFDDGGGRSLTPRPEGTAPICRAYIEHGMHKLPSPVKLWYFSSFFRAEAPQRGRSRQFWKGGAEAIGADGPEVDAELIILLAELLEVMGVKGTRLRLASLGTPRTRGEYREQLTAYLRANAERLSPEARSRLELNPMRAFDSNDADTRAVMREAPKLLDALAPEDAEHFAAVRELLDTAGVPYELDSTLVRGLDYYTRTTFEFTSDALGAQSGVGGGGRYDGLIEQLGGHATPGMGWAAGIERILLAGNPLGGDARAVDLYVGLADGGGDGSFPRVKAAAFEILSEARSAGLHAQMEMAGRSMKGQRGHANRFGARLLAIVEPHQTVLRDMQDGSEGTLETDTVVHAALRRLRDL